jgi:hypothetical protein
MIAQKSATLVTSLDTNHLIGNIQATKEATKSYVIVIGAVVGGVPRIATRETTSCHAHCAAGRGGGSATCLDAAVQRPYPIVFSARPRKDFC